MEKVMNLKEYLDKKKEINELKYVEEIEIVAEYEFGYPMYEDAIRLTGRFCNDYLHVLSDNLLNAKIIEKQVESEFICISVRLHKKKEE